jgi:hypothetical protein
MFLEPKLCTTTVMALTGRRSVLLKIFWKGSWKQKRKEERNDNSAYTLHLIINGKKYILDAVQSIGFLINVIPA